MLLVFGITVFNERINYMQLFGVFLMFSCAVLIGISDHGLERDKIRIFDFVIDWVPAYYSVFLAILSGILFGVRNGLLRVYEIKMNLKAFDLTVLSNFILNIILVFWLIIVLPKEGITLNVILRSTFSSILSIAALLMFCEALVRGYAGPCGALVSVQTVIYTFLNTVFYKEIPNITSVIGMFVGIMGTLIICLSEEFYRFKEDESFSWSESIEYKLNVIPSSRFSH